MKYAISKEETVYKGHYKLVEANVTFDTFNGKEINAKRLAFERGDSVAIILFEKETASIILTNQFRYPSCKHNNGWLLEIPAGSLEENEVPENCIVREVLEETGYKIEDPKLIYTFYTSPGAVTERIFLYFAEVSEIDKIEEGGGVETENEDIQLVKLPIDNIVTKLSDIKDAKTIKALQWFLLKEKR